METDLMAGCSSERMRRAKSEESPDRDRGDETALPEPRNRTSNRSLLAKTSKRYVPLNTEDTNRKLIEENTRLRAELTQATRRWLLLQNKTKYLQDNYDTFFKLRTEYQEIMDQTTPTRQPRLNAGTQTWDSVVCRACLETRNWLESPIVQELRKHEAGTVAVIAKQDLLHMQQTMQELQRQFAEHERTLERRLDAEEIKRLRHRRTLLEARLRTTYRELRAAKENLKILQMIIIKLERHRRAVMEAVKLDALLPSTCLSSVITDEEQWIVRRIVARYVTKAAKSDVGKMTEGVHLSPPSSVCSRHAADMDTTMQAPTMSCIAISQSSLIWPVNDVSVVSLESMDSEEAERRYAMAELMAAEEIATIARETTTPISLDYIPGANRSDHAIAKRQSNASIHILLPAGSSMRITETNGQDNAGQSCEIVYVSPACTPPRKTSDSAIDKEGQTKVDFTPITSAHLLFHTEEGIKKVNPFLEALKKISSDLAKFALPIMRYNEEKAIEDESTEAGNDETTDADDDQSKLEVVYLSPVTSPLEGSSTSIPDGDTSATELEKKESHESEPVKLPATESPISYPILTALKKISNNIEFYSNASVDRRYPQKGHSHTSSGTEYSKGVTETEGYNTSDSMESSDPYPYRMGRRYMCVLDIPMREGAEAQERVQQPVEDEPDLTVLSQSIMRSLGTRSNTFTNSSRGKSSTTPTATESNDSDADSHSEKLFGRYRKQK